jgi:hypothetical protein
MKNRLTQAFIIIALMLMSISVLAQDAGTDTEEVSDAEVCATFGEFAEVVHTARQSNMSLSQMMSLMPEGANEVERTILQGIILQNNPTRHYSAYLRTTLLPDCTDDQSAKGRTA